MPASSTFAIGDQVYRCTEPEVTGVVERVDWNPLSERWDYVVNFAGRKVRAQEAMLRSAGARDSLDVWDMLVDRQARGHAHLAAVLTLHRLRSPPARITDSYVTARTEFYPHQFKPLLKFLDNPDKRLLIGDDVGLGKTIEAGYILLELDAQQPLEHVLVLVPARLRTKWKKELEGRFSQSFDLVDKKQLLAMMSKVASGRGQEPFRWIASYESVRSEDVRIVIETTQPKFDLIIADEAHRLRNPEAEQHKVARELCGLADAVLFLSATPIQNRMQDLYHLLRLLSPRDFAHFESFQRLAAANQPLIEAQLELRHHPIDWGAVTRSLDAFDDTESGRQLQRSALRSDVQRRIAERPEHRADLVELQTDVGRLSPLGHIYTRTRKAEAIPDRAIRRASWIPVVLSPAEARIYNLVESLYSWAGGNIGWGQEMALMMVYRMTASCLPAALDYFRDKRQEHLRELRRGMNLFEDADPTEEVEEDASLQTELEALFKRIADEAPMLAIDTKLNAMLLAIDRIWDQDDRDQRPRQKVVIFSFFRRTIGYLSRMLGVRRIAARSIHGRMSVDEREKAIDEFLTDDDVRVLVTSDVGGEGIDLQCASVIVNYDLPWNPMVVEQRIGRLDRIGQVSARIEVLNFATKDSIESTILQRLLQKIGIFESTLGELDPIIGEQLDMEALARDALLGRISRDDLARRVEEAADAVLRQVTAARTMLGRVDDMMIADQAIIDEIHALIGERQIPLARELLIFANQALARRHVGVQIDESAAQAVVSYDIRHSNLGTAVAVAFPGASDAQSFARRSQQNALTVTFSREAAYRHPKCELLHIRHPLVRYAMRILSEELGATPVPVSCALKATRTFAAGRYLFRVEAIELLGFRRSSRLAAVFVNLDSGAAVIGEEASQLLFAVCDAGDDERAPELSIDALRRTAEAIETRFAVMAHEIELREQKVDQARGEQQRARTVGNVAHRVRAEEGRLARLRERVGVKESVLKAAETRLRNLRQEHDELAGTPLKSLWRGVQREEIIAGLVEIRSES